MEKDCLKVRMLGAFTMEYMGKPISFERNTMTKTNQLLQILLQAGDKGVSRENLLISLFGSEDITNPSNSLRATVFRLRKLLAAAGLPEDDYIIIKCGIYRWTSAIPVKLDVKEFEETVNAAQAETNQENRYELLKKACRLYLGEFLPQLGAEEWTVVLNVYYKNLYVSCMNELCEQMKARHDYQELYQIASNAVAIYPLEEWQIWQIDSLIAMNRGKEAMKVYEDTSKLFFEELGIAPSERMMAQLGQMSGQIHNKSGLLDDIQEGLKEKDDKDGAYFCSYPSFAESYRYIKRVLERTGQSAYLLLCSITDGKGYPLEKGERLSAFAQELDYAICCSLRRGDLYTRYSANQYLMLLMELKQEDCNIVMKRINSHFEKSSRKNYLKYSVAPLSEVNDTNDSIHFETVQSIWK